MKLFRSSHPGVKNILRGKDKIQMIVIREGQITLILRNEDKRILIESMKVEAKMKEDTKSRLHHKSNFLTDIDDNIGNSALREIIMITDRQKVDNKKGGIPKVGYLKKIDLAEDRTDMLQDTLQEVKEDPINKVEDTNRPISMNNEENLKKGEETQSKIKDMKDLEINNLIEEINNDITNKREDHMMDNRRKETISKR